MYFSVPMDIEPKDILFTPFAAGESAYILGPFLDIFTAGDSRIISTMFQINCQNAESQTGHLIPASSEDDVDNGTAIRLFAFPFHLLIGIGYVKFLKCLFDPPKNTFGLIYGLYDTTLGHLKVEMCPRAVIIAAFYGDIPASVRPTLMMLVGLIG